MKLYRIIARTTGSLQPRGTYWDNEVMYCGYDLYEAQRVYHASRPLDRGGSYGNRSRETLAQSKTVGKSQEELNAEYLAPMKDLPL